MSINFLELTRKWLTSIMKHDIYALNGNVCMYKKAHCNFKPSKRVSTALSVLPNKS